MLDCPVFSSGLSYFGCRGNTLQVFHLLIAMTNCTYLCKPSPLMTSFCSLPPSCCANVQFSTSCESHFISCRLFYMFLNIFKLIDKIMTWTRNLQMYGKEMSIFLFCHNCRILFGTQYKARHS